ncbi:KGG domain-containing protein [Nitrosomonas supralitoralis]|nr:KGG domain-containing protein [Nitrosomonas supralitoralis]
MTYSRPGTQDNDSNKGFASMDEDKQREISSKGGKAAHEQGTAHEFDSEEAREAGSKGGQHSSGNTQNASNSSSRLTQESSNSDSDDDNNSSSSSSGGSSDDHARAGNQSHKNT